MNGGEERTEGRKEDEDRKQNWKGEGETGNVGNLIILYNFTESKLSTLQKYEYRNDMTKAMQKIHRQPSSGVVNMLACWQLFFYVVQATRVELFHHQRHSRRLLGVTLPTVTFLGVTKISLQKC